MTLPLSHQHGASVRQAFSISKNHIADKTFKPASPTVVTLPLLEARERFIAAFEIGTLGRLLVDENLNLIDANNSFKNWLEVDLTTRNNHLQLKDLKLFNATTLRDLQKKLQAAKADLAIDLLGDINLKGETRHVQIAAVPVNFHNSGSQKQYMLELHDITELERHKSGLSEAQLQLRSQNDELKKAARVVSHDLRAPAINISNLLGLLEKSEDSTIDPEILNGLKASINSILGTIHNSGTELNSCLQKSDGVSDEHIDGIIQSIINDLQSEYKKEDVTIGFEAYDTSDWKIPSELLKMVLTQLVSNSIKFKFEGRKPEINISAFKQNGKRIIRVHDNGSGIDFKGQEQRLFGLFQTFHSQPDTRGVGLFQVKNRMKSIGGDVHLETEVGCGTTVSLNFN